MPLRLLLLLLGIASAYAQTDMSITPAKLCTAANLNSSLQSQTAMWSIAWEAAPVTANAWETLLNSTYYDDSVDAEDLADVKKSFMFYSRCAWNHGKSCRGDWLTPFYATLLCKDSPYAEFRVGALAVDPMFFPKPAARLSDAQGCSSSSANCLPVMPYYKPPTTTESAEFGFNNDCTCSSSPTVTGTHGSKSYYELSSGGGVQCPDTSAGAKQWPMGVFLGMGQWTGATTAAASAAHARHGEVFCEAEPNDNDLSIKCFPYGLGHGTLPMLGMHGNSVWTVNLADDMRAMKAPVTCFSQGSAQMQYGYGSLHMTIECFQWKHLYCIEAALTASGALGQQCVNRKVVQFRGITYGGSTIVEQCSGSTSLCKTDDWPTSLPDSLLDKLNLQHLSLPLCSAIAMNR